MGKKKKKRNSTVEKIENGNISKIQDWRHGRPACLPRGEKAMPGAGQVGEGRRGTPRGDGALQDRHAGTGSEYSKYWLGS